MIQFTEEMFHTDLSQWVKNVSDALDSLLDKAEVTQHQRKVFFDIVEYSIAWFDQGIEEFLEEAERLRKLHFSEGIRAILFERQDMHSLRPVSTEHWYTPLNQVVSMSRMFATCKDMAYLTKYATEDDKPNSYLECVADYLYGSETEEIALDRDCIEDDFRETMCMSLKDAADHVEKRKTRRSNIKLNPALEKALRDLQRSAFYEWYCSVNYQINKGIAQKEEARQMAVMLAREKGVRVEDDSIFYAPSENCSACGCADPTCVRKIDLVAAKKKWAMPGPAGITYSAARRRGIAVVYLCVKCQNEDVPDKKIPFVSHLLDIGWKLGRDLSRHDIINSDEMWPEEREVYQERARKAWNDMKPTTVSDWIYLMLIGGILLAILFGFVYVICTAGKH